MRTVIPEELLQRVNMLHSTTFTLLERYVVGEQGAFAIADVEGNQYVLKWKYGEQHLKRMLEAKAVTDVLLSVGYPASHFHFIGCVLECVYSVQMAIPGIPVYPTSIALIPRLLELNKLQAGQALLGQRSWHDEVVNTVLFGGDGYCLHASLQQYSYNTANLLKKLQMLVSKYQTEAHRTNDIVHGDFQQANILVHNNQVSGIIDWDAPYAGDRIFDVATLLFYSYDVPEIREHLWSYALEHTSFKLLSVYFAHLILRQVDWSLRYHDKATSKRYILRGYALLEDIFQLLYN